MPDNQVITCGAHAVITRGQGSSGPSTLSGARRGARLAAYVSLMMSLIRRVVPDGVSASALSRFMISM